MNLDLEVLKRLSSRFRAAIKKCEPKSLPVSLQCFPRGACGDAALLLAKYLEEHGYGLFDYVLGEREGRSHAWLQSGSLIVDITADQFEDQDVPVIVTRDNSWHSTFHGEIEHVADFCIYDDHAACLLKGAYEKTSFIMT